ncbi:hypothetical protein PsYK624_059440 [Phanerochaete sordida]|uniref:Uncharacterized protein n=1 Tax=Phanerochaete sordida TaxID=48140 RepID=A0A9P3G9C8_9APHY|nr:hypothetical protein PsYK624_059440 [Phanerochaete sordida]
MCVGFWGPAASIRSRHRQVAPSRRAAVVASHCGARCTVRRHSHDLRLSQVSGAASPLLMWEAFLRSPPARIPAGHLHRPPLFATRTILLPHREADGPGAGRVTRRAPAYRAASSVEAPPSTEWPRLLTLGHGSSRELVSPLTSPPPPPISSRRRKK